MLPKLKAYLDNLSPFRRNALAFGVLAIAAVLVYFKTVSFNYCIDDQYYLWLFPEKGSSVMDYLSSLRQRFWHQEYRPVTYATLLIEGLLFGRKPSVHHVFNLIYYILLCFLIFSVVRKFLGSEKNTAFGIGLLTAIFFLLHPSHANVVSSIKNREVILSLSFGLLSMYAWWKFLDLRKFKWILISAVLLVIGIFAKRDILTFLLIVPLSGLMYSRKFSWKADLRPIGVFLVATILLQVFIDEFAAEYSDIIFNMGYFENPLVGAEHDLASKIPYASYILVIYEKFMLCPTGYYFYFGFDQIEAVNYWNALTVTGFLMHLCIIILMIVLWRKKLYQYLFGPMLFFLAIAPFAISIVSGIVSVRYSFIASLGFCLVLAQLAALLNSKFTGYRLNPMPILLLGVMVMYACYSHTRSKAWEDLYTLYATDLPHLERSVNANRMAGQYYFLEAEKMEEGAERTDLLERSQIHAEQALSVYDKEVNVLEFRARGLQLLGRNEEALKAYAEWVVVVPSDPEALSAAAHHAKAIEAYDVSIGYFERLVNSSPFDISAHVELTQLYIYFGRFDDAVALNNAFYRNNNHYDALLNFGDIYIASGDTARALEYYDQAVAINEEDYIIEEVMRISNVFGNREMAERMKHLLEKPE